MFFFSSYASASIPALHNLLPFWLAKKVIALAKFAWALYSQWRHSTTPTNTTKTDGASKIKEEEPSQGPESSVAKTGERRGREVNGGVDRSEGEGESDEGSSKDKDSASRDGAGGASKVKRRRGKSTVYCSNLCMDMNEGGWGDETKDIM